MSEFEHDGDCAGCREYNELSRRQFIAGVTEVAAAATVFTPIFPAWLPNVVLRESEDSTRDVIVSIFLRGGADGLSLCVPFSDANYYTGRPTIAIPRPDSSASTRAIPLDNNFGFAQAMSGLVPARDHSSLAQSQSCCRAGWRELTQSYPGAESRSSAGPCSSSRRRKAHRAIDRRHRRGGKWTRLRRACCLPIPSAQHWAATPERSV